MWITWGFINHVFIYKCWLCLALVDVVQPTAVLCRDRSNHLRQDGGLCFELPPWQHQPVELQNHIQSLKERWETLSNVSQSMRRSQIVMVDSEISRYMDTVLSPFLDTYHKNIQTSYQQLSTKILRRIKDEINAAVLKKHKIYSELIQLADSLQVPEICDEERRSAKTLASKHVSDIYKCTEDARAAIFKMGKYAEHMIGITKNHMQSVLDKATKHFLGNVKSIRSTAHNSEVSTCLKKLSQAAVVLGYELDLSLTNARRYNEQCCERLSYCTKKAKRNIEDAVVDLRDKLYQCVYA